MPWPHAQERQTVWEALRMNQEARGRWTLTVRSLSTSSSREGLSDELTCQSKGIEGPEWKDRGPVYMCLFTSIQGCSSLRD